MQVECAAFKQVRNAICKENVTEVTMITEKSPAMTMQESSNIDLAEKAIESPVNPRTDGLKVNEKDKDTVLHNFDHYQDRKNESRSEITDEDDAIVNHSDHPDPDKSQAV